MIEFLAAPFVACLALVLVLGYLGIHILLREVIFVDLALAQIAALGTIVAFTAGHEPGSAPALAFSLAATLVGAGIFAWSRVEDGPVPQEAIIGITYIVASALSILIADRAPEGAEHIKELLAGAVIWVTWEAVAGLAAVAGAVGAFHWVLRRRFLRISEDPDGARTDGWRLRWWDFLFYASFGVVVTAAVEIAGVLMVFTFLVAPAILALTLGRGWLGRLLIAWGAGAGASALGLWGSYRWDFPAGPAVVCALGLMLVVLGIARWTGLGRRSPR